MQSGNDTGTPAKRGIDSLPSIAEGPTIHALIAIHKAYSLTDAASLFGRMLRTARWPSRLAVLLAVALVIAVVSLQWERYVHLCAFALVGAFYGFKRDAFRAYYAKRPTATFLDTFSRREQAVRYVIFRENLPEHIAHDLELMERVLRLLEQRQKVRRAGLVLRHPAVTTLTAFFLMLLGVIVSKAAELSFPLTAGVAVFVLLLILMAMQLGVLWRTREYRDEELTEFVLWMWAEARDKREPGGTAHPPKEV